MIIKITKWIFSTIFGVTALILIGISAYEVLFKYVVYDLESILFSLSLVGILCWLSAAIFSSSIQDKNMKHKIMISGCIMFFLFYCLVLYNILFKKNLHYGFILDSKINWSGHYRYDMNIIPLKTILTYIIQHNNYNSSVIVNNLLGNLCLFAPFGFFLPIFHKRFAKLGYFALSMLIGLFTIELLQFLSNTGSFDVDDILLNISGAIVCFFLCKTRPIQWIVRKCHL